MHQHTAQLVNWWRAAIGKRIHPEDKADSDKIQDIAKVDGAPVPYVGNLTNARLVMVMLNPGHKGTKEALSDRNLYEEEAREKCLVQDDSEGFWPLTVNKREDSLTIGGREYWRSIFKSYAVSRGDVESSYVRIAQAVCCVQLVPYPSGTALNVAKAMKLKSVCMMQEWINEEIRLANRPVIVFRGWPYLENLRGRPNDGYFCGFKPDVNFLRRPSFNPSGKYSLEAAKILDRVLAE